ncbi:MAG: FAD:protein FMN transferase [Porticoccaceae bacterium]|jgi:thiamine biosynthesis lipoprotein|nr:FAD:protein FMN transferase [Porticoccaceae bacterium]
MTLADKQNISTLTRLNKASFSFNCVLLFAFIALLGGCNRGPEIIKISGSKMGTSYHVTIVADQPAPVDLAKQIEQTLDRVDQSMSTYKVDSEISQFNQLDVGQRLVISDDFDQVLRITRKVWQKSGGTLDPTVGPLVDIWGFGPTFTGDVVPSDSAIQRSLASIGFDAVNRTVNNQQTLLSKSRPLRLDLSAVAKGYAVDLVADLLEMNALPDYLVEVGGETRVSGLNPEGDPWRLAIESPSLTEAVAQVLNLEAGAVATSGDYRNYFERDGVRYSHTIDPRSGRPTTHSVASVTVVADTCAEADAWATALMVMNSDQAVDLANELKIPVYIVARQDEGYTVSYSETFTPLLGINELIEVQ